jgi:hypothetical protein
VNRIKSEAKDNANRYCYDILKEYINMIIKLVCTYNSDVFNDKYKEASKNFCDFTLELLHKKYAVKFYTLNYDNLIPQILTSTIQKYKLDEGLDNSFHIERHFNYNLNTFCTARLSHFNLHGSIFLKKVFNSITIRNEIVYSTFPSYLDVGSPLDGGNPGQPLLFLPIIAGYNKTQRIFSSPFNFGFNAFVNDCSDCNILLTIGYSFSDPHINSILASFIDWKNTQFVHVTKYGGNFSDSREYIQLDHDVTQICINKQGDTWDHDMNNHKHIYKQGFEEFLKDKSKWEYTTNKFSK